VWHARTRQLESSKPTIGELEAPEETLMIESTTSVAAPVPAPEPESGIFSSATVAALRGLGGGNITTHAAPKASGPLVAYGSDDDSD
jgi:hypothetical protein